MKTLNVLLTAALLVTSTLTAFHVQADTTTETGKFYVTLADCSYVGNSGVGTPYYVDLHLNRNSRAQYDPSVDMRVGMAVESCQQKGRGELMQNLEGKAIFFEIGRTDSGLSSWGPQALNYSSIDELIDAANGLPPRIRFVDDTSKTKPGYLQVKITSGKAIGNSNGFVVSYSEASPLPRIFIDIYGRVLSYRNSAGEVAINQSLTQDEATLLARNLSHASDSCPVIVEISGAKRRVVSVKNTCVDLSLSTLQKNQG